MDRRKLYSIVVHNVTYSSEDIIINKLLFEDVFKENDYIRICDEEAYESPISRQNSSLVMQIKSTTLKAVSGGLEISLSKNAAEPLQIKSLTTNKRRFVIEKITAEQGYIDFVELAFTKRFLSRGNMWRFKNAMVGRPIYVGQNLDHLRIKAPIQEIGLNGVTRISGIILKDTNFIFRSRYKHMYS
jgi:Vacuolar membrane-associated protein Iml1